MNRLMHVLSSWCKQFGLQAIFAQKAQVLSGGYKQRFMIARASHA